MKIPMTMKMSNKLKRSKSDIIKYKTAWEYKGALFCEKESSEPLKYEGKDVNAQRIERQDGRTYLACEGPNFLTVYDFWALVWQENVTTLVSANFPHEERLYTPGCPEDKETIQYWPICKDDTFAFMPFKITCVNTTLMNNLKQTIELFPTSKLRNFYFIDKRPY
ncbi:unnamed protein product [Gongylonema pulchrum]|uniref:Tyrosine-protein phosphatase domain-containing protein n=1 Tax=Gongylonema pulchrum TaxID=637853 RepID=A0A183EBK6_9BILA|nr:unnamed protein product [Gongylonema pulchrum]